MDNDLLTPDEAAKFKGVSRAGIYSAMAEGRLQHSRILGRLAIKKEHLLAWSPVRHAGRPKGQPMTEEAKARLSESQKRRWSRQKHQPKRS